jgi:hypothetical protein
VVVIDELVELIRLARANRDAVPAHLVGWLLHEDQHR